MSPNELAVFSVRPFASSRRAKRTAVFNEVDGASLTTNTRKAGFKPRCPCRQQGGRGITTSSEAGVASAARLLKRRCWPRRTLPIQQSQRHDKVTKARILVCFVISRTSPLRLTPI